MNKRMIDLAEIQFGAYVHPEKEGKIIYLQARNFDSNGILKENEPFQYLHYQSLLEKRYLQHGDILFAAKGVRNTASLFLLKDQPAIASSSFFTVRIKKNIITPEYLMFYLNLTKTQNYFIVKRGIGTTIPSIKKQDLEELTIDIPPLDIQEKLVSLKSFCEKEKQLSADLVTKKEILYQSLFNKIVKEN